MILEVTNNMENSFHLNDQRITFLLYRINKKIATLDEKFEYVDLLYKNKYITLEEHQKYMNDLHNPAPSFIDILITIGAAIFLGNVIGELFSSKKN